MSEQNEQTNETTPPKEICTIRILFPVVSDAQALEVKGKISAAMSEIKNAQVHFSILPTPPTMGTPREPQIR